MSQNSSFENLTPPDPAEFARNMAKVAERSQKLVSGFMARQAEDGGSGNSDPLNISAAFTELTQAMMSDPQKIIEAQTQLWQQYMDLWQGAARRMAGEEVAPVITPARGDNRFRDSEWAENQVFDFVKQSYLLTARWLQDTVHEVEGLDDATAKKVDFYTRQFTDAMSPSNFGIAHREVAR